MSDTLLGCKGPEGGLVYSPRTGAASLCPGDLSLQSISSQSLEGEATAIFILLTFMVTAGAAGRPGQGLSESSPTHTAGREVDTGCWLAPQLGSLAGTPSLVGARVLMGVISRPLECMGLVNVSAYL